MSNLNVVHLNHPVLQHIHLSTSKAQLDIPSIYSSISQTYWAKNIPLPVFLTSIENSLCIGVYDTSTSVDVKPKQIGFARWVTDYATFGWLNDVYILEEYQGQGLGKWLVEVSVKLEDLKMCRNLIVATSDAQELYENYGGFTPLNIDGGKTFLGIRRNIRALYEKKEELQDSGDVL